MSEEVAEFWAGVREGEDPQSPADEFDVGREAVTQKSSPWANSDPCRTCGQTFRRGDRVVVDERGVRHLDPALGCALDRPAGGADDAVEAREFSAGLLAAWPAAPGVDVVTLAAHDWHVARPGPWRKPTCIQCGDTFRVGETVVLCPCRPGAGGGGWPQDRCGYAIHRDPAAGLPCWESWRPTGEVTLCPLSHTVAARPVVAVVHLGPRR
jgi:hypothetical protein